jgi:predicted MFS family arabinose efflux permease
MNAVAPAVVEQVAVHTSWATAFGTAGLGALLCAALSLRIRDPGAPADADGNGSTLFQVARRRGQLVATGVIMLVGSALSAVFNFHQLYALELGIEQLSVFFVAYSAAAISVRLGLGHLMDAWGNRRCAIAALLLYPVAVLAVIGLDVFGLALVGAGLGFAHGLFYPSYNAAVVAESRPGERGKVMALFQAAFQVGMAGGGLLLGLLADAAGYPAVFQTAAAGLVAALLLLLLFPGGRSAPSASRGATRGSAG